MALSAACRGRRTARLLLRVVLMCVCISILSSVATAHEVDDVEEDDDWDFMSDDAIFAAAAAQKAAERHAHTCAMDMPAPRINDNYCDCADGSDEPETSACASVSNSHQVVVFQCKHTPDQRFVAAFVDDGVCDCCDGSDEKPGTCSNTCEQRRLTTLASLQSRLVQVQAAQETRMRYAALAGDRIALLKDEFSEIRATTGALQRAFQYRQQELQTAVDAGVQPSQRQISELRRMYQQLNHWQYTAYIHHKLTEEATFDRALGRDAYVVLVGECFPFTVNEKQLKGGSSNVIPREYVIVFCPFQNITQTEPGYAQWQRAERQSKTGVVDDDNDGEDAATQAPILMGVWDDWLTTELEASTDTDTVVSRQQFTHGEACVNGQERLVNVDLLCADENRVLSVEEPRMCEYLLRFATPAACSISHERVVHQAIDALQISVDSTELRGVHEEL